LVQIAGAGDELQGIKRGIMEMADGIVINKADGSNVKKAEMAAAEFRNALHLFPLSPSGWAPQVLTCSSIYNIGVGDVWNMIEECCEFTDKNHYFEQRRRNQARYWMFETINTKLHDSFYNNPEIEAMLLTIEQDVINDKITPFEAAQKLLNNYFKR
jgi:LAO/AO transport system kinase